MLPTTGTVLPLHEDHNEHIVLHRFDAIKDQDGDDDDDDDEGLLAVVGGSAGPRCPPSPKQFLLPRPPRWK